MRRDYGGVNTYVFVMNGLIAHVKRKIQTEAGRYSVDPDSCKAEYNLYGLREPEKTEGRRTHYTQSYIATEIVLSSTRLHFQS